METPTIDTLKRGSADTKEMLVSLSTCNTTHHATVKEKTLAAVKALNALRAEITDLQSQLQTSEMGETDAGISGKFEELRGLLRTSERLASTANETFASLARHLQRAEAFTAEVVALATKPLPEPDPEVAAE